LKKHKVGLIRVLTVESEEILSSHGRILERAFPELEILSRCIEDQPKGIYDEESEEIAKPKIVNLAKRLEKEGVEAIIISCAADPAVKEAREMLKIPVIGAGSAAASLALTYGRRVGVLNLTERTPRAFKEVLGENLIAEDSPEGVKNTLDLMTQWGQERAREAAKRLKEKGAEVIAFACTGYSTIGLATILERDVGLPVIDAVIASGAVTLHALRRKRAWEGER